MVVFVSIPPTELKNEFANSEKCAIQTLFRYVAKSWKKVNFLN